MPSKLSADVVTITRIVRPPEGFTCGDEDLDDFLAACALEYQRLGIATTYIAYWGDQAVGYITLIADSVELKTGEKKKLNPPLGHGHPRSVPALKIARLGVSSDHAGRGCGRLLVRFALELGLKVGATMGCRLLTVDAYPGSVEFYEKLEFTKNKGATTGRNTSMRLDLFRLD